VPNPIEQLKAEHRIIEKALRALDGLSKRIEQGEAADTVELERLLDFLSSFADQRHHQKEEQCLFPALGLRGMPRDRGPVGILLQEHCTGRAHIAHMRRAATALANGNGSAGLQFAEAAHSYVGLLTAHIQKEDAVLFREAEKLLDERAMQSLQDDFEQAEAEFSEDWALYERAAAEFERAWAL